MGLEFFEQPDSRQCPVALHRTRCDSEGCSYLLDGKTAEVSEFDNLGLAGVHFFQPVERFINLRHLIESFGRDGELILEFHSLQLAAALVGVAGAGVVDQNSPHDMSGEAYEMFATVPIDVFL